MLRKFLWLAILAGIWAVAFAGIQSPAAEECGKGRMGHGEKACIPCQRGECADKYLDMADELGLSEAQIAKLKDIHTNTKKLKIQKKADMEIIKLEINSLLDEASPDQSKIDSKVDKLTETQAELMKECLKASIQARQALTPEQYKQAKKSAKKMTCPMGKSEGTAPSMPMM